MFNDYNGDNKSDPLITYNRRAVLFPSIYPANIQLGVLRYQEYRSEHTRQKLLSWNLISSWSGEKLDNR